MKKSFWFGSSVLLGLLLSIFFIQNTPDTDLVLQDKVILEDPYQDELFAKVQDVIEREDFYAMARPFQEKFVEIIENACLDPVAARDFPMACFAPGTSQQDLINFYSFYANAVNGVSLKLEEIPEFQAPDANRWSTTASGGGLGQGDPTTLTWSYVADGTVISSGCGVPGESTDPSNFIAFFNGIYGGPTTPGDYTTAPWHAHFITIFNQWSSATGLTFVYEPMDDGMPYGGGSVAGALGVRGDVRIGGHRVDGNSMVLACNYFPNTGDMIIDTEDNFYGTPGTPPVDLTGMLNVLAHEIGHGLGFRHVCPVNTTKLMEPFVTFAFGGPQADDILAGNRLYGDADDNNETTGAATALGAIANPGMVTRNQRSIDDNLDLDNFSFSFTGTGNVTVTMTPTGSTYLEGPQNTNGSCSAGTSFNSLTLVDLQVELIGTDGTTVLATGNAAGAGIAETAMSAGLPAGTYFVRVSQQVISTLPQDVQMYNLQVAVASGAPVCAITGISVTNISACNNNGTPTIPGDDTFTADVTVTYSTPPATGSLNLTGDGTATVVVGSLGSATMHTFAGVTMSADGTPISLTATFSAMTACTFSNTNAGTAPSACSTAPVCSISAISVANISACNDNATPANASDDFFTADVTVTYANAPATGSLDLTGDGTATVAVGSLGSATMHTFVGVQMSADGGPIALTATFSANTACTFTGTSGTAPASCATAIVPTMGEWGLMVLGLILAIFGIVAVRNRKNIAVVTVKNK